MFVDLADYSQAVLLDTGDCIGSRFKKRAEGKRRGLGVWQVLGLRTAPHLGAVHEWGNGLNGLSMSKLA